MIPAEYTNYFLASTGAAAALLGLLFVSVSISPERIFGTTADVGRRGLALSAFTALANAFFVSLSALIPHVSFGYFVIIAGFIALGQSVTLLLRARQWRREGYLIRGITLFVAGAAAYGGEIDLGILLLSASSSASLLTGLLEILLAVFAIGLTRAWELLGAPQGRGPVSEAVEWIEEKLEKKPRQVEEPRKP